MPKDNGLNEKRVALMLNDNGFNDRNTEKVFGNNH